MPSLGFFEFFLRTPCRQSQHFGSDGSLFHRRARHGLLDGQRGPAGCPCADPLITRIGKPAVEIHLNLRRPAQHAPRSVRRLRAGLGTAAFFVMLAYLLLYRRVRSRRVGVASVGTMYDLLNENRRKAVEIIDDDLPPDNSKLGS